MMESSPIEYLKLSSRAYNALVRAGINTLGELYRQKPRDLLKVRGIGRSVLKEIQESLEREGLVVSVSAKSVSYSVKSSV